MPTPGRGKDSLIPAKVVPLSSLQLRCELTARNLSLCEGAVHESTCGDIPSVLYKETNGQHFNFIPASYRRICASPEWSRRLKKHYSGSSRLAWPRDRIRRELDCANSSDALLMNIFCYPGVTSRKSMCALLNVEPGLRPQFGVRPGLPMIRGGVDRTEIDMSLGRLFVEAKLTESGFQTARRELLVRYRDVADVFDMDNLPMSGSGYHCYQLIRGVLAAHHCGKSFLILSDARRADLIEAWFAILRAVRSCELRSRLAHLTWQELASVLPKSLQKFLSDKYGIHPQL
ncbi:MAG: hypothetical protein WB555_11990 [Candidatus Korobacteraceae bacterium]